MRDQWYYFEMVLLLDSEQTKKFLPSPHQSVQSISAGKILVIIIFILALFVLTVNVYVYSYSKQFFLSGSAESPFEADSTTTPVALVLGASVHSDGTLSPLLEERAKAALDLYQRKIVTKILVSGDNRVRSYNEVIPIRAYLLGHSVPPEDIFTDFAGFNTYDSLYRAKKIFGVQNLLIVTQHFHLPRALYVARKLGLNAYGISAGGLSYDFKNNIREVFATTNTYFRVYSHAKPLFLGRQISIGGDGRESLK